MVHVAGLHRNVNSEKDLFRSVKNKDNAQLSIR